MPKQRDPTALVKAVASVVREQIAKAANALTGRIDALERKFAELPTPKDGRDGIDGKDGAPGERGAPGRDGIDGKEGPAGKDGADGKDGRDGIDGKDGQPGERGADGKDGRDGVDGKDGSPGEKGCDGIDGKDGAPGRDGIDGKSVTVDDVLPLFNQAFDKWALDFERRAQDIHTRLLATFDKPKDGRDGIDGKDGTDGLGFDDIDITHDGERGFTIAVVRGERRKEFTFQLPVVLERGVYKAGHEYARGDGVTADGSYWIAQKDSPSGRPGQSPDWRLSVKRGRDGKGS